MTKTYSTLLNMEVHGSGPTLVLIHGVAGSLHIWDPVVDKLSESLTVVRVDLLGYGHSPKPKIAYTPKLHVEAIRSTLLNRKIKPPFILTGLSMGVSLALEYAALYPDEVSGFIGIGFPYYPSVSAAKRGLQGNFWTKLTINYPHLAQIIIPTIWFLGRHHCIPAEKFSNIYTPLMAHETLLDPYYAFRSNVWNCMVNNPQTAILKESGRMKRLFIHGEDDVWASPGQVQAALAPYDKSSLMVVAHTGHNVIVLQPNEAIKHIKSYVASIS